MKKLLTFAVAAVAASALQAATIAWGGETLNSANTAGYTGVGTETSADYEGYAAAGTTYALILVGAADVTASTYDPSTGLTDAGGTVVDTYTLDTDDADGGQFSGSYAGLSADEINGKYFMVTVYDPMTKTADYKTFQVSGASDNGGAFDSITPTAGLGGGMGSVQVVPEPTTVALLALGLAAVGLKRKVA
jgi:hypothetical protein